MISWTALKIITTAALTALPAVDSTECKDDSRSVAYRAVDWNRTKSTAVRFEAANGTIDHPRRGTRYQVRLSSQTARK
ncbi:MAG: hypothetical protein ACKVK0_11020 [Pirellulales bacterium]